MKHERKVLRRTSYINYSNNFIDNTDAANKLVD